MARWSRASPTGPWRGSTSPSRARCCRNPRTAGFSAEPAAGKVLFTAGLSPVAQELPFASVPAGSGPSRSGGARVAQHGDGVRIFAGRRRCRCPARRRSHRRRTMSRRPAARPSRSRRLGSERKRRWAACSGRLPRLYRQRNQHFVSDHRRIAASYAAASSSARVSNARSVIPAAASASAPPSWRSMTHTRGRRRRRARAARRWRSTTWPPEVTTSSTTSTRRPATSRPRRAARCRTPWPALRTNAHGQPGVQAERGDHGDAAHLQAGQHLGPGRDQRGQPAASASSSTGSASNWYLSKYSVPSGPTAARIRRSAADGANVARQVDVRHNATA